LTGQDAIDHAPYNKRRPILRPCEFAAMSGFPGDAKRFTWQAVLSTDFKGNNENE
jgi:hypothetical protein